MSRILPSSKKISPTATKPVSSQYKVFIWDLGTDSRPSWQTNIRTIAAVEFSSRTSDVMHFSTAVRPLNVSTKKPTPTFPDAWLSFSSFIANHSYDNPSLLVSHNAAFDVTVLLNELQRANIILPSKWRFACSLHFARSVHSFTADNSQIALAMKLGIVIKRPHHTSEDVIVLRQILVALDQNAIKHEKPSNRVITALSDNAREPAFFDRTPQPVPNSGKSANPVFFITQTGTRFHREGCKWLHRSSIPRQTPPPGFKPCRQCRPDDKNYIISERPSPKQESNTHVLGKQTSVQKTQVFVTKTGSKYHVEGCKWLGKSKIPKDSPPEGFKPCGVCVKKSISRQSVKEKPNSTSSAEARSKSGSSGSPPYYVTKTGSKYHVGTCSSLSRSRIPKDEIPSGYDACGKCLPNVAYVGTPQVERLRV